MQDLDSRAGGHFTCMMSFLMGVAERRSYRAMERSLPADANRSGSAGLKRTLVTLSAPQAKPLTGSERS